ncbi:hypothetical protein JOD63_000736 [Microbacterium terrae]|uniref:Uncharacterized protein n=1 Tax=Microbacterium terrae TaxID=69369 RepID=A0A0M2H5P6_9MICO|nr:DUF6338 family protein [Microbacterium terrae]KJL39299.1 hypothetical protein RS81_02142 [Microbacterium terrae]MBP1076768.1 hypothetical protein [Microbacterium terrae]GLJ99362.1 hypothetical protein GCM10017594_25600 [Microbacterium terrae]
MGTPEGGLSLALFVVLALPGFVYAAVRRRYLGELPGDRSVGQAIARGIIFSIGLTAVYLLVGGDLLARNLGLSVTDEVMEVTDFRLLAIWVILLYLLVPLLIALLVHHRHIRWTGIPGSRTEKWPLPRSKYGYLDTPTPWDEAVRHNKDCWVSIRKADGHWVGGWVTDGSISSSYPESPSIYINRQYEIGPNGARGRPKPDSAVWVLLADGDVVSWERPGKDTEEHVKEMTYMERSRIGSGNEEEKPEETHQLPSVGGGSGGGAKPPPA